MRVEQKLGGTPQSLSCAEWRKFVFRVYPVFVLQIESRAEAKAKWSQWNNGFSTRRTTDLVPEGTTDLVPEGTTYLVPEEQWI